MTNWKYMPDFKLLNMRLTNIRFLHYVTGKCEFRSETHTTKQQTKSSCYNIE